MKHLTLARAAAITALAGAGIVSPVATAPASAQSCSYSYTNKSAQYGWVWGTNVNIRTGPFTWCDSIGEFTQNEIYAHCWRVGTTVDGDDVWWHVRLKGSSTNGWISAEYTPFQLEAAEKC